MARGSPAPHTCPQPPGVNAGLCYVVSVVSVHSPQLLPRPGLEVAVIITSIAQIEKLRLREVRPLQVVGGRVWIESGSDRRDTGPRALPNNHTASALLRLTEAPCSCPPPKGVAEGRAQLGQVLAVQSQKVRADSPAQSLWGPHSQCGL